MTEIVCLLDRHPVAWALLILAAFVATTMALGRVLRARSQLLQRQIWIGEDTWGDWPLDPDGRDEPPRDRRDPD
jgi:hypothetical protein